MISNNHKNFYTTLNYIEHLLISVSTITGCASISTLASLSISIKITSSTIGLKICATIATIKKYK